MAKVMFSMNPLFVKSAANLQRVSGITKFIFKKDSNLTPIVIVTHCRRSRRDALQCVSTATAAMRHGGCHPAIAMRLYCHFDYMKKRLRFSSLKIPLTITALPRLVEYRCFYNGKTTDWPRL
ncbi:MAG: hypothetical protein KF852_04090 [Saprospiraceae bacterium]|nr:hypothetical protein [Saprospiraceae bacterium]